MHLSKKLFFVPLMILVTICNYSFSQQKINYRYKKTKSGLGYKLLKKSKGEKVNKSDKVTVVFSTFHKTDSSQLRVLVKNGTKDFFVGHEEVLPGWDEAVQLLKVGDSAVFKIPPHLAYGDKKVGSIDKNSTVYLFLKVQKKQQVFFNHIGLDTIKYESGLKKILVSKGNGVKAKPYSEIKLSFTGYVYSLKGYPQIFEETNFKDLKIILQLGAGKFVKGLDEGILTMEIGEKATFIVPPQLGYGKKQMGKILPNTTLYYDIELVDAFDPFLNINNAKNKFLNDSIQIYSYTKNQIKSNNITTESIVTFDYKAYYQRKDGAKIMFDNSFMRAQSIVQRPGSGLGTGFPGIEESLLFLHNKDTATIHIPNNKILNKKKLLFLPEGADVFFDIYVLDVKSFPFLMIDAKDTLVSKSGLKYIQQNLSEKDTLKVKNGFTLNVAYTIYFLDSLGNRKILDCSRDSGKPLNLTVGNGKNIPGFEEGLLGMSAGMQRRLFIPSHLAYGKSGVKSKGLPPSTDLIMDIEYIEILNK